jgi:cell division septum initiation protein DivIVA
MSNGTFDNLAGGSRVRLATYKRKLAKSLETIRACRTPADADAFIASNGYDSWKRSRYITPHGLGFNAPQNSMGALATDGSGRRYGDSGALDHLRVMDAGDVLVKAGMRRRADESRWYADSEGRQTVDAHVAQLPAHKRAQRWLAFVTYSEADGVTIENGIFDSAEDAATAACGMAQELAESQREYSDRWDAAQEIQTECDEALSDAQRARRRFNRAFHAYLDAARAGAKDAAAMAEQEFMKARERFNAAAAKVREYRDTLATNYSDVI